MKQFHLFNILMVSFTVLFLFTSTKLRSQYLLKVGGTTQYYDYNSNLGIGTTSPGAKLHVRATNGFSLQPVLKTELFNNPLLGSQLGVVENLVLVGGQNYGIYETSSNGLLNYFQDPLQIGSLFTISNNNTNPSINTGWGIDSIVVNMQSSLPGISHPLTIYPSGIRVKGSLVTDQFQMLNGPGLGWIMVSDKFGIGTWTDPSTFNDKKWLINNDGNLYEDPSKTNVGIGHQTSTDRVYQRLHILDGNILISRSNAGGIGVGGTKAPSSENGSILFGDVVNDKNTLGEWGIEYQTQNTDYNSNGLNFWKPFSSTSGGGDNYLYLRNDGNVGIGTNTPGDKLQVNVGIGKVDIGAGPANLTSDNTSSSPSGNGYLGFNLAFCPNGQWYQSGNTSSNGSGMIYNSVDGDMYFTTLPNSHGGSNYFHQSYINQYTQMRLCQLGGVIIGQNLIDNVGTTSTLELRNSINTNLLVNTVGYGAAGMVIKNTANSSSFGVDNSGVFRLYEGTSRPILSFSGGLVGIGNVDITGAHTDDSRLWVDKGITTEAVYVHLKGGWSDFVFNDNYKKKSIPELEKYIKENKKLPDIPSASEVENNGIELGKMNAILLQKIEELTLYIVDQQKQIDDLKVKINK
jgi:hypothetical protein